MIDKRRGKGTKSTVVIALSNFEIENSWGTKRYGKYCPYTDNWKYIRKNERGKWINIKIERWRMETPQMRGKNCINLKDMEGIRQRWK